MATEPTLVAFGGRGALLVIWLRRFGFEAEESKKRQAREAEAFGLVFSLGGVGHVRRLLKLKRKEC
jgi:hypothetical protein